MTHDLLLALVTFAFVTSVTPGPNNMMLMASGANFGVRRTLPHMAGVAIGFVLMMLVLGAGLVQVFEAFPASLTVLRVASILYLLYLAWKIATAAPPEGSTAGGRPITFLQAVLFQWVNPKAWAMALTGVSTYSPGQTLSAVAVSATIFGLVNLPSVGLWAVLGQQMRRFLTSTARLRTFNAIMALLLVGSLYPIIFA